MHKNNKLLIYTEQYSPRLIYITNWIGTKVLGLNISLTQDVENFLICEHAKLYYSPLKQPNQTLSNWLLRASGLLFEKTIQEQDLKTSTFQHQFILFKTNGPSMLPFDVFAASFYQISRYEEYLPHLKDQHGRFSHQESLAFQNGVLATCLVDRWIALLADALKERFPALSFKKPQFLFTPTIDIDHAYAFKYQGFFKNTKQILSKLKNFDFENLQNQINVLMGKVKDPFDTYDELINQYLKDGFSPIFFVLLGNYGGFDTATNWRVQAWQAQIKAISDYSTVGIHPSYAAAYRKPLFTTEKNRLEHLLNKEITHSRFHYLRISLPESYQILVQLGIKHDYSMAFAGAAGFRASTSHEFPFFDLETNQETKLIVHPVAMMDGTFKFYQQLSPEQSLPTIAKIMAEVKQFGGNFIPIWHNNSVSDWGNWRGWRSLHDKVTQLALFYEGS